MLGGMSRRMQRRHLDIADMEAIPLPEQCKIVAAPCGLPVEPAVLPLLVTFGREVELRLGALGELAGAGEEVRVNVCLGHCRNAQSLAPGNLQIAIDIPLGIDHQSLARTLAADQVGGLRELLVIYHSKEHGCFRSKNGREWKCVRVAWGTTPDQQSNSLRSRAP